MIHVARNYRLPITLLAATLFFFTGQYSHAQPASQLIVVDMAKPKAQFKPIWAYFGYDEPNYTYMKDGRKLLSEIAAMSPVPVYVRAHNLLTSGDGEADYKWGSTNVYTEDANGKPVYYWRIVDSIFDTYVQRGMKPIAEIGFMPEALSTHPQPYRHYWKPGIPYEKVYTGWAYPPKDYNKWGELVYQWVKHCVERYGVKEVNSWWWEVWNEPNIGYWKGTPEEFYKLYDYAADAVKRACPGTRVGGPTSTGPSWDRANTYLLNFLNHCDTGRNYVTGKKGAPLEYVSYHAKGAPRVVNGHVRMNMATQFKDIYDGFKTVANHPKFKKLPIIIGECDPEGCAACSMQLSPQNAYRNGTMYSSYTASAYARIYDFADSTGANIEGAVSWSFEFENQRWFDGFRDLATNGIDKPVLNVFRMFGMMNGNRLTVTNDNAINPYILRTKGVHDAQADIQAFATGGKNNAGVMLWNYHDDDLPAEAAIIDLKIQAIPSKKVLVHHYRIDNEHSNSYELWKKMGSPQDVTPEQYKQLENAGQLQLLDSPQWVNIENGTTNIKVTLPRQGVSFVRLTW